jgi:nucleotide-binding universal stress UspA family protein
VSFKNIVLHIDASPQRKHRLDVAATLAKEFDAHLSVLYVIPETLRSVHMQAGYAPAKFIMEFDELEQNRAKATKAFVENYMAGTALKWDWREQQGLLARTVALNARYADLAILGQAEPPKTPGDEAAALPADVALTAGRPVLIVPYVGVSKPLGSHVLVGWNASREATRAVNDAIPLLQRAEKVTVLTIDPEPGSRGHGEVPGADISLHLARHGVRAEAAQTVASDIDVGDVILSRTADLGADLIVIGAYGHSRVRESLLGGVTRDLLRHMTVPVMMSH